MDACKIFGRGRLEAAQKVWVIMKPIDFKKDSAFGAVLTDFDYNDILLYPSNGTSNLLKSTDITLGQSTINQIREALGLDYHKSVLRKCAHCGQYGAVQCACPHCGAPIDPE